MPSGFKDIAFGMAAAETERANNPNLLIEGFFDVCGYFDNLVYGDKFLILGSKGSGKSAIASRLELDSINDENLKVATYYLEDFPYSAFSKLIPNDEDPKTRYPSQWELLFLISFLDSFSHDPFCKFIGKYKVLNRFLKDLGIFPGKSLTEMVKTAGKREFRIKLTQYFQYANLSEQQKINQSIEGILRSLKEVCYSVETDARHIIIVDKLDEVLTQKNKQLESLTALIMAAEKINRGFKNNNVKAKAIVLCRTDLYEKFTDPNKNKIRQDSSIELDWYQKSSDIFSSSLIKIINLRAKISLKKEVNIFREYFPERIWNEEPAKTLLDNTRYRPRDIIMLLNYIQQYTNGDRPTAYEVREGIRAYSYKYFLPEIRDELAGYLTSEEIDLSINLLGEMGKVKFDIESLKLKKSGDECYNSLNIDKALRALYDCSAIGNVRKNTSGQERFSFKYRNPNNVFYSDSSIKIHWGMAKGLNI